MPIEKPTATANEAEPTLSGSSSLEPLNTASTARHIVQIYKDVPRFIENVSVFIATGLEKEEGVVILGTPEHWKNFRRSLHAKGFEVDHLIEEKKLTFIDAQQLYLDLFKDGEEHFVENFTLVVHGVIQKSLERFSKFRVFGELVDILCSKGRIDLAIKIEKVWHQFAKKYDFALFCGYHLDNLKNNTDPEKVIEICENHSHLLPQ